MVLGIHSDSDIAGGGQFRVTRRQSKHISSRVTEGRRSLLQRRVVEGDRARAAHFAPRNGQRTACGQAIIARGAVEYHLMWQRNCLIGPRVDGWRLVLRLYRDGNVVAGREGRVTCGQAQDVSAGDAEAGGGVERISIR